jgi:NitT/TauT family transport system substrate-binding protein
MADIIHATPVNRLRSRRQFLKAAGGLGLAAAGLGLLEACGAGPIAPTAATTQLETTTIRIPLGNAVSICTAPLFMAERLLKAEGFTNIQYIQATTPTVVVNALASGAGDMAMQFSGPSMLDIDAGKALKLLAGIHVGCFVLFGTDRINTISDLNGKTVGISQIGGADQVFLSSILAYVGLDPMTDVNWTVLPIASEPQVFIDGKIDAFLAFPPLAQRLRAEKVGHVVVDSMVDAPWAQYFCCFATFNQDFAQKNPVATKHALRALLKATDQTALHPEQAAQLLIDKGFATNYQYALAAMQEIPYNRWRVYNPEDTVRFYALLLNDAKVVKRTPDELIKQGTDWTYLNQLKAELPATPVPTGALAATRNLFCTLDGSRVAGAQRPGNAE